MNRSALVLLVLLKAHYKIDNETFKGFITFAVIYMIQKERPSQLFYVPYSTLITNFISCGIFKTKLILNVSKCSNLV